MGGYEDTEQKFETKCSQTQPNAKLAISNEPVESSARQRHDDRDGEDARDRSDSKRFTSIP